MENQSKIMETQALADRLEDLRGAGKRVVFTNGCFDIIHFGHLDYLEKSKNLGDKLVVGLNTDRSVRQLKGQDRPINSEYARARTLAACEFVDAVITFNEETPIELIKKVKPDILTKGNDYSVENIVGSDFVLGIGGEVKTIDLLEGFSTSALIEKIKKY